MIYVKIVSLAPSDGHTVEWRTAFRDWNTATQYVDSEVDRHAAQGRMVTFVQMRSSDWEGVLAK